MPSPALPCAAAMPPNVVQNNALGPHRVVHACGDKVPPSTTVGLSLAVAAEHPQGSAGMDTALRNGPHAGASEDGLRHVSRPDPLQLRQLGGDEVPERLQDSASWASRSLGTASSAESPNTLVCAATVTGNAPRQAPDSPPSRSAWRLSQQQGVAGDSFSGSAVSAAFSAEAAAARAAAVAAAAAAAAADVGANSALNRDTRANQFLPSRLGVPAAASAATEDTSVIASGTQAEQTATRRTAAERGAQQPLQTTAADSSCKCIAEVTALGKTSPRSGPAAQDRVHYIQIPKHAAKDFRDFARGVAAEACREVATQNPYVKALNKHRAELQCAFVPSESASEPLTLEQQLSTKRDALSTLSAVRTSSGGGAPLFYGGCGPQEAARLKACGLFGTGGPFATMQCCTSSGDTGEVPMFDFPQELGDNPLPVLVGADAASPASGHCQPGLELASRMVCSTQSVFQEAASSMQSCQSSATSGNSLVLNPVQPEQQPRQRNDQTNVQEQVCDFRSKQGDTCNTYVVDQE